MDIINNRARDIASMALDGLYERSKAISSNTANALTPNYQRKEVSFEESLQAIIQKEDEKEQMRLNNAQKYQNHPELIMRGQSPKELAFLASDIHDDFMINVESDNSDPVDMDGNNVNLETEMMDEARTGMQYQVLSTLLSRSYQQISSIVSGQGNS